MSMEPREFSFQDNTHLLKIKHKLYALKEVLVSTQYLSDCIQYHFDSSNSSFAINSEVS